MMQNSQQLSSSMPPHLSPAHMENPNQNTTSSPQLSAQGYSHQLQSSAWAGNKVCHGAIGQNSNMETYPQQVTNRFYPGAYASHQNAEMTRYMNSAPNSHHSVPAAYGTQYAVARQTNYATPGAQNYQASMNSNCGNAYYGNINSQNAYGMNNIVSQQRKYANSPLCPSRTTQGLPQNLTQMAHNKVLPQPSSAYAKQPIQHTRYVSNYNMLSSESQPNCGIRHQLTSPSVSISTNQDSPPALTAAVQSVNVQLSSIPTPPEASSIPGDLTSASDGSALDVSVDSSKLNQVSSSSFALPGTTVSHSVGNMSSATLALTTSVGNSIETSRTQVRTQGSALQPPPNMDEGSQASSASASSSIPDEQNSMKANSKPNFSYPPTPNTLSSPGAASMSSFHDELECISSPGWPRTPASPVANNNYEFSNVKRPDSLMKLYNLSEDPDRRYFLDKLLIFNEDRGSPITQCPTISKQPLDVYRVYLAVKERGGFVEVTNAKRWKDIAGAIGVGASSSAAYTLRKQYMKLLLPFECKFDRGGIDPQPIINQVEASSRKKGKAAPTSGNQNPCNQAYPQANDGYHPSGYPASYHPPSRHHCSSGNMDYHCVPSHVHYPQSSHHPRPAANGVVPAQTQYGQYWHSSQPYGYYQGNSSSVVPVHNNNTNTQATVNGTMCRYANNSSSQTPEQEYYSHNYASHSNHSAPTSSPFNNRNKGQESIVPAGHYPLNRTMVEHEPLNSRSSYPSADTTVNTTVQTPSDHYSSRRTVEEEPFGVPSVSSCHSSGTVVRDSATCYNSNYSSNKTVVTPSQDQCIAASGNCTPVKPVVQNTPQSYQQPNVESNVNKTFQPVSHNATTTAVPCHGSSSNFSPSYYSSQQAPSQTDFQPKTLNQANQYGQYVQTQNENYRGSEGPPNFQSHPTDHRGACSSTDNSSTEQLVFQTTTSVQPTKPNNYVTYSQPPTSDQEQYSVVSSNEQYNRSSRGWASDSHCQYQLPSVQATFPHDPQITSSDVKYCPETPRIAKPWPVTCDTPQTEVKPPVPSGLPALTFSPNKNQTHSVSAVSSICLQPSSRKPVDFPLDSVESTTPVLAKRKRYTSKDVSPLEAWRLMMALKSGLLGECTWALDVLSVLLCDNSSIVYFGLSHLPGLLEVLVEHYRYFLNMIFNLANDLEIGYKNVGQKNPKGINSNANNLSKEHVPNGFCEPKSNLGIDWREKTTIFNTRNYTYRTRCQKPVRIKADEALFLIDPERKWDTFEGFNSGTEYWQIGGGETTMHIQAGFEDVSGHVKFARNLDDEKDFKAKQKTEKKRTSAIVKNLPECLKEYNLQSLKLPLLSFKGEPIVVLEKCCIKNIKTKHSHHSSSDNDSDTEMEDNESLFASAKETTSDKSIQKKILYKELTKKDSAENVKSHEIKNPIIKIQHEDETNEKKILDIKPQEYYSPTSNSFEPANDLHPSTQALQKENMSTDTENQISLGKDEKHSIVVEGNVSDVNSPKIKDAPLPDLQNNEGNENLEDFSHSSFPRFRSTPSPRKRVLSEDLEEEAYCCDEPALFMSTESQDALAKRCICISTILRNLSFVPGNDLEMKKHSCFLLILGRLLLLHHEHKPVKATHRKYDKEVEGNSLDDSCISLKEDYEWWWDMLHILRDNTLVTLSNIAGQLDLTPFPEEISLPILDGLLHWVVCPSSYAQDPMPTQPASSVLSPQRLSLEALCKLSVLGNNVDLMIATPPWSRIERLFAFLTKSLNLRQDQVVREFALVLLSNLSQADPSAARTIAEQNSCISYLIAFVEQAESSAFQIASSQGIKTLRENPELMGTTPDMVQRAASILKSLACIPENQRLFFRHQHRLLALVTSQIIDQAVASIIADVLFYCSEDKSGPSSGIALTAS